ncbi:hypothetical protein KW850_08545 [Bacillus sp. sid0103]|uniref:hypothetical protein n=1 Tax=Bacillus sp. sid0103 TaxID=2856337 RepID=UPI001C46CBC6|nr:hypothetical protein [Bacillus sp. sid0103]MBV7505300.1 hypothetical protein [Bacillus sp. sid0103]
MAEEVDKLKKYLLDSKVNTLKTRISDGDIPLNELDNMVEYIHRDFEELQLMDVFWNHCSEVEKKVILFLQQKTAKNELTLSDYWV